MEEERDAGGERVNFDGQTGDDRECIRRPYDEGLGRGGMGGQMFLGVKI